MKKFSLLMFVLTITLTSFYSCEVDETNQPSQTSSESFNELQGQESRSSRVIIGSGNVLGLTPADDINNFSQNTKGLIHAYGPRIIYENIYPLKPKYIAIDPLYEVIIPCNAPNGFCETEYIHTGTIYIGYDFASNDGPILDHNNTGIRLGFQTRPITDYNTVYNMLAENEELAEHDLEALAFVNSNYFSYPQSELSDENVAQISELLNQDINSVSIQGGDYLIQFNEEYPNGYIDVNLTVN